MLSTKTQDPIYDLGPYPYNECKIIASLNLELNKKLLFYFICQFRILVLLI